MAECAELPADPVVVCDRSGLRSMLAYVLSGARVHPVVGISASEDGEGPVLEPCAVREVVGDRTRIYFVADEDVLEELGERLGARLALCAGAARIWWPNVGERSDPADHPLVLALDGESEGHVLGELARQFDLSRPHVRREMKLIEDCLALAEHNLSLVSAQLEKTAERLRDAHRERHREATRAEGAAEDRRQEDLDREAREPSMGEDRRTSGR
jgi:hypothetical protein